MKFIRLFSLTILVIIGFGTVAFSQLDIFKSTQSYNEGQIYQKDVAAVFKKETDTYVHISKFVSTTTSKKDKVASKAWAIRIDDELYINFRYSPNIRNEGYYIKPDIFGEYCVYIIDKQTDFPLSRAFVNPSFTPEPYGWNVNWRDKEGDVKRLVVVRLSKYSYRVSYNDAYSECEFLSRGNFNRIFETSYSQKELKNITYEDIMDIVKEKNALYNEDE